MSAFEEVATVQPDKNMTTSTPHGVTERLSLAMREAQEEFAKAFPGAERAVLIAQWWGGKLDLQGQVKTGQVWHTGSRLSGAENIDAAIKAVRTEMGDAHRLRLEAADLIRRALIIEGGAP